jgi:hypothetical protein
MEVISTILVVNMRKHNRGMMNWWVHRTFMLSFFFRNAYRLNSSLGQLIDIELWLGVALLG